MPHEVKLELTRGRDGETHCIEGSFDDAEWVVFHDFVQYTNDLLTIQIVRDGAPGGLSVRYEAAAGFSYEAKLPPDEQVIALLHRLRPFVLQGETTNFNRVCAILGRRLAHDTLRDLMKTLRDQYSGKRNQGLIQIRSNDTIINSEETLMLWLNAHEYHRDRSKQEELAALHKILPLDASRAIFVMMLFDKVNTIFALANIIHRIISGPGTLTVHH